MQAQTTRKSLATRLGLLATLASKTAAPDPLPSPSWKSWAVAGLCRPRHSPSLRPRSHVAGIVDDIDVVAAETFPGVRIRAAAQLVPVGIALQLIDQIVAGEVPARFGAGAGADLDPLLSAGDDRAPFLASGRGQRMVAVAAQEQVVCSQRAGVAGGVQLLLYGDIPVARHWHHRRVPRPLLLHCHSSGQAAPRQHKAGDEHNKAAKHPIILRS
jgi:hypothetical protein